MKLSTSHILLGCLAFSQALAAAAAAPQSSSDEATIRKIDTDWSHAAEAGDLTGVLRPYASDGAMLAPGATLASGTDAIRQVWSSLVSKPGFSLKFTPTQITIARSRDMAWELGTFQLRLNDPQGKPSVAVGKYVVTWTRVGGEWKVAADIFNTNS
jgi:ketosteroid isomerase-like protein